MMMLIEPESERLPLGQWLLDDRLTFVGMSSDETAMACFPALLTRVDSDALASR